MKAQTLADVMNLFDARRPLQGDELRDYYVERPGTPLQEMVVLLRGSRRPVKLLFTGHRGSGKSTELNRLAEQLGRQFFIVRVSATETLNPYGLTYVDLLMGLSNRLFACATDADAIKTMGLGGVVENVFDNVYRWWTEYLLGEDNIPFRAPSSDLSLAAKVNVMALQLEAKMSAEADTRKAVRARAEERLSELMDHMNYLIVSIRRQAKREALIIAEDIDKIDLGDARTLYLEHASTLTALEANLIYTYPVALRYSNDYSHIRHSFDETPVLPNIKVFDRAGNPHLSGRARLRQVVLKRMEDWLITPQALDLLIEHSGGLLVTLVSLVQGAAIHAIIEQREQIDVADVQKAIARERADYQALLEPGHYDALRQRLTDKMLVNDATTRDLLYNQSLLEYANDEWWCDVHPIVRPLLAQPITAKSNGNST